ncbi:hypothetical protein B4R78_04755 [Acinetobacter nosocomialis]|nr:hypothetical protein APC77_09390 [Acinetobacter nosocomialis]OUR09295.1 hypothetical protein B4R78_04755 [Acinetobacter nosocomialis]
MQFDSLSNHLAILRGHIVIHNDTYIFESVEPAENLRAAMLIAIDIERTRPEHKHITLHAESILKLCKGIQGKPLNA